MYESFSANYSNETHEILRGDERDCVKYNGDIES